ncbi:MAG: hypothetical protein C0475_03030 [Planctomyces sp.]|nr:hypothetical protein [Planctomyces sp.]MBA4038859.1 hypothetical protein [Planctomyces sp.]MBA4119745.1 hypothetical protein [Isosphaera sp.]
MITAALGAWPYSGGHAGGRSWPGQERSQPRAGPDAEPAAPTRPGPPPRDTAELSRMARMLHWHAGTRNALTRRG